VLKFSKQIRDPVLGWIWLTDEETRLIDSCPYIQRLRYVHQLGLAHLVYPTARHTRFEHSLGVMHISTKMFQTLVDREKSSKILQDLIDKLGIKDQKMSTLLQHLRIAALLHDIGHYPFSHSLDNFLSSILSEILKIPEFRDILDVEDRDVKYIENISSSLYIAKEHECITYTLLSKNLELLKVVEESIPNIDIRLVKDILFTDIFNQIIELNINIEYMKDDIDRVKKYDKDILKGLKLLHNIISSSLDSDRIDYMLRDLYFTGASVSTNITLGDVERILTNMDVIEDDEGVLITYNEKARASLEGFVIARYNLYKWVYLHHKVTLMSTLMRLLYMLILTNIDKIVNIEMVIRHVKDIIEFLTGCIDSVSIMRLTDYYVYTMLSRHYKELIEVLGNAGKYIIESLLIRKNYFKPIWKRDVEFEHILKIATGEDANQFNARIGALIYEVSKNPKIFNELLSIFYRRLIHELKIASEIYNIDNHTRECIEKLCSNLEKDPIVNVVIGYVYFEPDVNIYISSIDRSKVDLKDISPLTVSVKEAWDRSPKIFIYINSSEISNICTKDNIETLMKILKICIIKALDSSIKDLVNIYPKSSLHKVQILQ